MCCSTAISFPPSHPHRIFLITTAINTKCHDAAMYHICNTQSHYYLMRHLTYAGSVAMTLIGWYKAVIVILMSYYFHISY